jgi:competence ComEA-like helix-hairpin-helix protein
MKFLKEYFVFSSSERRGILLFTTLFFLLLLGYFLLPFFAQNYSVTDYGFRQEVKNLLAQANKNQAKETSINQNLFKFNPNTLSLDGFISLGLSQKQAQTILNYRNKGGKFYKTQDFKKIYAITDKDYERLAPFIVLANQENKNFTAKKSAIEKSDSLFNFNPNTVSQTELVLLGFSDKQTYTFINYRNKGGKFYKPEDVQKIYGISNEFYEKINTYIVLSQTSYAKSKPKAYSIEINTATAEEFKQISGIGEKISERIVNYRDKIGGFYSVSHLAEVYGVEVDLINKNLNHLTIDKVKIKKLNINTVTIGEFYKHPYVSFNDARKIVNFREVHGLYTSVNEIRTNDLVKDEVYSKIVNYLIL